MIPSVPDGSSYRRFMYGSTAQDGAPFGGAGVTPSVGIARRRRAPPPVCDAPPNGGGIGGPDTPGRERLRLLNEAYH